MMDLTQEKIESLRADIKSGEVRALGPRALLAMLAELTRRGERITELERDELRAIEQRDAAEEMGTRLANAVGEHFRVDVGEYSNLNDPRETAIAVLEGEYVTDSDKDRRIATLEAERDAARLQGFEVEKDAARYRWLRDESLWRRGRAQESDGSVEWVGTFPSPYGEKCHETDLDVAIDAAIDAAIAAHEQLKG